VQYIPYLFYSIFAILLGGCAALDHVENRVLTANRVSATASSETILLNIVRASRNEPLNFTNLTGLTGHDTGSIALPTTTWPPHLLPTYGITNGTGQVTVSNDFNVSVPDDPNSYAALLAPVNPAIIGLLIKQGYPRQLIFSLLIDHVKILSDDKYRNFKGSYFNDPLSHDDVARFTSELENLVILGLTVESDNESMPSTKVVPSYLLCFDKKLPVPNFFGDSSALAQFGPKCDAYNPNESWKDARSSDPTQTKKVGTKVVLQEARPYYHVYYPNGDIIRISTRSVFGIYEYLGRLVRRGESLKARFSDVEDPYLFSVSSDLTDCFVSISDMGRVYCVPNSANNTKRIFAIIRQLIGILTAPSNQPSTQTVRTTP
jgi:hypothetical protein